MSWNSFLTEYQVGKIKRTNY